MNLPPLPELPPDRYSRTGDIKDVNWLLLEDVRALLLDYGRAVQKAETRRVITACEAEQDRMKDADRWPEVNAIGRCLEAIRNGVIREGEGE